MSLIKLNAAFKDYLWGGEKLKSLFNKESDLAILAESWELSTHPDGASIVASGNDMGKTFQAYLKEHGKAILGSNCDKFERFPVLIKFIDAKKALSIQVHPNDEYALRVEKEYGKSEMWIVLEAEADSFLYYGVNKEMSKEEFKKSIDDKTLTDSLNKVNVKKGDVFFIAAGTIHAIGAGIVICEIQQNSNTTYRVFDYSRVGADGKERALHIDKAVDVSCLTPTKATSNIKLINDNANYRQEALVSCKYFSVERFYIKQQAKLELMRNSFQAIVCVEGSGSISCKDEQLKMHKGDTFFIGANSGEILINGNAECIRTFIE